MRDGFFPPAVDAAIDVDAQRALVPRGATVKGMMFQSVFDHLKRGGRVAPTGFGPYLAFKDYPGQEFVSLLATAASILSPDESMGHGLVALGRLGYPTLRDTMIGRVLFSFFAHDIDRVLPLASRAYRVSASTGVATLVERGKQEAVIEMRDIYSFLETYHFGVLEGVLAACQLSGVVGFQRVGPMQGRFHVAWTSAVSP